MRIYRIKSFVNSWIKSQRDALSHEHIRAKKVYPGVLLNAIPKAGTHLAESALDAIPGYRNSARRTIRGKKWSSSKVIGHVRGISRATFRTGHVPYNHEIESLLLDNTSIKMVFVIRDPRAVALSLAWYVGRIDRHHTLAGAFSLAENDDERLTLAIRGNGETVPSIVQVFKDYSGWLRSPAVMTVRFEDLVGPHGGGSVDHQEFIVSRMLEFLGHVSSSGQTQEIAMSIFNRSSPTFRSGKISGWQEAFNEGHHLAFSQCIETMYPSLMEEYGYSVFPREVCV
jgi:hypothetical protein